MKILLLLTLLFLADRCERAEPVLITAGCMQSRACNFSPNANKDDGSCNFCSDCSGKTLESSSLVQTVEYNVQDLNANSPNFSKVFSILTIDWVGNNYCTTVDNVFFIKFKNTTNRTVSFDYYIESRAEGQLRSAQGIVRNLAPNSTFEKNQGKSAFWNLKVYPVIFSVRNVEYN